VSLLISRQALAGDTGGTQATNQGVEFVFGS